MCSEVVSHRAVGDSKYPRDDKLENWENLLKEGDVLNFRESKHEKDWYEGVVVRKMEEKVVVRKLGSVDDNSSRKDVKIAAFCLEPLFSKVKWRMCTKKGDFVEVKTGEDRTGKPIWKLAEV